MGERLDIVDRLHRRLLEIIRTGLPLIPSSMRDADLAGLTHLRDEMVETIDSYHRHASRVHEAAMQTESTSKVAAAEALCRSSRQLQQAYQEFRARWVHRHAAENWAEYRLSALRMMKLIRNHVLEAEEEWRILREGAA